MPFDIRDSAAVLYETLPEKPQGLTLASTRAGLHDPLEDLCDCVANNTVPTEKLLNDLAIGVKHLYDFADKLEDAFKNYVEEHEKNERRMVIKIQSTDGASQAQLTDMMRLVQQQLQAEVIQDIEQTRQRTRQRAREEREGEAREA